MAIWLTLIPAISQLLDKIIPDPHEREKAKIELMKAERLADIEEIRLALRADQIQTNINQEEARSPNLFVSGWRPFIGWVCGVAFAYHFVLQPILAFVIANNNSAGRVELPTFDMQTLSTVLMGMLGLGGLRTLEKIKNATK